MAADPSPSPARLPPRTLSEPVPSDVATSIPAAPDAVTSGTVTSSIGVHPARAPRAGELSARWRLVTAVTWIAVGVALGAVWRTSDQLGLSTWWIGPRGDPNWITIQLLPFVPAVLMVLATINRVRWLAWMGLVASAAVIAIGVGDLGRVAKLGVIEVLIGAAAAATSLASLTGTYRRLPVTP